MSKILKRPMFRGGGKVSSYGNGIATGLADGGEVQPLLVGQHPESAKGPDGREEHGFVKLATAAGKFLPAAYRGFKASRAYQPFSKNLGIMGRLKDTFLPSAGLRTGVGMAAPGAQQGFATGSFLGSNPLTSLALAPQVIDKGYKAGKYALTEALPEMAKLGINTLIPDSFMDDPFKDPPKEKPNESAEGENSFNLNDYLTKSLSVDSSKKDNRNSKEKIADNKKIFEEAMGGGKKAMIDDLSTMGLSFASKALKEGATTKSAFAEFFEDESKRPSRKSKISDAASQAAIQAYLSGETSYAKFRDQLAMNKDLMKEKILMADANTSLDDRLNEAVKLTGERKTSKGVIQSSINGHFEALGIDGIKYAGEMPETITDDFEFVEGGVYSDPQKDGSVKIFIVQGGIPKPYETIFGK